MKPFGDGVTISIVIPVFNEALYIENLLNSLEEQQCKNFEVIIVDNNSTDSTIKLIKSHKFSFHLHLLNEKKPGPGNARKKGMDYVLYRLHKLNISKGLHYLATTDADAKAPYNWTKSISETFKKDKLIGALAGIHGASNTIESAIEKKLFIKSYFNILPKIIQFIQKKEIGVIKLSGPNACFTCDAYAKSGGIIQPLNSNGSIGLHEVDLLGKKIIDNGYLIKPLNVMVESSHRRHLYDLINRVVSYEIIEDENRFMTIRDKEECLLSHALEKVPINQWIDYRQNLINNLLASRIFIPLSERTDLSSHIQKNLDIDNLLLELKLTPRKSPHYFAQKYSQKILQVILNDFEENQEAN